MGIREYDEQRISAIERTWLTPNWIPAKEFAAKAAEDVQYLMKVIRALTYTVAQLQNNVRFKDKD